MLHVCCINNGNYLGRGVEYTNILHDMVRRNLPEGFPGDFTVFTDDTSQAYDPGIIVRELPERLPGWWAKLGLFKPRVFPAWDRVLFLDLDTLITGPLDAIAAYDGDFATLRDVYRPDGLQSSVMAWRADGPANRIWFDYEDAGRPKPAGGDQAWIERAYPEADILQEQFPGLFESYKASRGAVPAKASVVVFHGQPRPHEVGGWAAEVWKVGGMSRAELTAVCNTADAQLAANVKHACALDLPWFDFEEGAAHEDHCVIVGGGPSLLATVSEIRWRQSIGQTVWALNNAARFLERHGIDVDCQVILDARPDNAAFVSDAAGEYLLASQCHPDVFRAAYPDVTIVWHPHTEIVEQAVKDVTDKPVHLIGGGTTVGTLAMSLAFLMGFRKIHLYGFDSCYHGPEHHAYPQPLNANERLVDVMWNDRKYVCAPWMAGQADEFLNLWQFMTSQGTVITAHGEGLIPDMCKALLQNPPVTPAEQRAIEVVKRVASVPSPVVAEIGVFAGDMSAALLNAKPDLKLIMVDSWEGGGKAYADPAGDFHARLSDAAQQAYFEKASARTRFARGRATICRMRSDTAARVLDAPVDLAFIDADHSYEGCARDIAAWWPRVKPGGWLGFHDYQNGDFPEWGVTRAVDEFAAAHGLALETGLNFTAFIQKPER
ncbi:MAG TPA: class I SAM-dependent methyltransferase [Magnetospirillum sp.]|nr:class I SAM-dependent methyltransferase [Magnetospirillum sp.]